MSRERIVSRVLNPLLTSLPEKFVDIYPYQVEAVDQIVEAFDDGVRVVVLEAPTGSGKTLIAECVRRMLKTRGSYVCHNKELQAQFARDFEYSAVLYGRANYIPIDDHVPLGVGEVTCEDCTWTRDSERCELCPERSLCPYVVARGAAIRSVIPVLNSAYWLNEVLSTRSMFGNRGLTVFDEADTLEGVLLGQVEVFVSQRRAQQLGITPPNKLTKGEVFGNWCKESLLKVTIPIKKLEDRGPLSIKDAKELKRLRKLEADITNMYDDLTRDSPWVYTGGAGSDRRKGDQISFKPVKVESFGQDRIWTKDKRFLLMSGTVVSHQELVRSLGLDEEYRFVGVESQFHPKNRQVVVKGIADMTRKGASDDGFRRVESCIRELLGRNPGGDIRERAVIHSVSYQLAGRVRECVQRERENVFTYRMGSERAAAIAEFKRTPGSVLLAPSADRGVDLPGDECRLQIILKVPFLSLGDKQVAERLYKTKDGAVWYNVHVARTIMQMVGRGVRSEDDWCVVYILDSTFTSWYRQWGRSLFPKWFQKAVRFEQ